ncbi:MAG: sulfatase-like hydrolase/transferase [Planctomycetota bacterium]|jgi:hypothetical protein
MKTIAPTYVLLLGLVAMLPEAAWAAPGTQTATRPNVLFIAIDDLRPSLGCYGDALVRSPHIDRLAETGLRFRRAYCQQAVCGPSRASLLTGLLPDKTRVWHNRNRFRDTHPDAVTLPQLFKRHGYHTQSLGKVFSGRLREDDPASWSVPSVLIGKGWQSYVRSCPGCRGNSTGGRVTLARGYATASLLSTVSPNAWISRAARPYLPSARPCSRSASV